jgi:dienelactone hydrolase
MRALKWLLGATFALAAPGAADTLERPDGSSLIYHLDRPTAGAAQRGVILMLQGSGCDAVATNAAVGATAPRVAPGHAMLLIEKYGVALDAAPAETVDGCTPAFWRGNTLRQRLLDVLQVVARLRREPWWNRELVIYGGSEGGAVAALLAPLVPEAKAVVIRSSGIGVSVADLIRSAVPPAMAAQLPAVIAEAKANPMDSKRFGGASYRWWADAADIVPAKALLDSDVPILLIHGSRDQFAPVATARATRDRLAAAGRPRFTYREYDGYDHFMVDAAGRDRRAEVDAATAAWIEAQR